jgi:hypothetical protein
MKRLILALVTAVCAAGLQLVADDIVLVPGTINGTVTVTGVALNQITISASGTSSAGSASTTITPNGGSSGTYSLTVNVPQSSAATFNVTAWAYSDNYRDYMQLPAVQTSVATGAPGTANLGVTPGFIDATINVSGATVSHVQLNASHGGNFAQTSTSAGTNYRFAVAPGSSVGLSGSINLLDGRSLPLAFQTVSVTAGETTSVTYNVAAPAAQNGSIVGTISFPGPNSAHYAYVHMNGPSFRSQFFNAPLAQQQYQFNDVAAGTNYFPYSYVQLNNFDDYFQFPTSSFSKAFPVAVSAGQTTIVDIAAEQAFINSALTLSGAPTLMPLLNSGSTNAAGVHPSAASGGQASDQMHMATRTFDLIVSPGTWQVQGFSLSFFRPSPHLSSNLNYFEFGSGTNVSVTAGETKTRDFNVALGEVTLTLSVAGGGAFSHPQLFGNCSYTNGGSQQVYSYSLNAYSGVANVTSGQLTIAGPTGKCTVFPSMQVGSSSVSLPPVTLEIVAGTSQVIDIGGPTLTMTSPAADQIVPSPSVTVSGRVTDDVGVAYVKVNGQDVTLSSASSLTDTKARQFSTTVSNLQPGPNTITTNAGDTSSPAKTASDTRIVYYDQGGPSVAFMPADGTTTLSASVPVTGTADDDAGVSKIAVNGSQVAFASTNNPLKPEEVSFSAVVPLLEGPNPISVTVTDISTRTTSVTHTITRQTQQATALALGPGSAPFGGQVTVSAVLTTTSAPVGVLAGKTVSFTLSVAGTGVNVSASGVTGPTGTATATLPVGGLNPGTYAGALSATFAAENNYLGSTALSALTVNKLDQSISFAAIQNHTLGDAPFEIAATASSNLEVRFSVVSGAASVSGKTVTLTGGGPVTIRAAQNGDAFYTAAPPVDRTFTVAVPDLDVTSITLETRRWNGHVPADSSDAINTYFSLPMGVAGYAPAPKTLTIFDGVSNHATFNGVTTDIGYHHHFAFNAPLDGTLTIRMGADFGGGGTLVIDGQVVQFRNTDMWWNGSYSDPTQYLSGTVAITAGPHTIDSYGFEGCCDGPQQAQYSYLGAPFKIFQAPANEVPAVTLTGPASAAIGSTHTYSFSVTDPDEGASFSLGFVSCGVNGSVVGLPAVATAGGSFDCSFPAGPTSTIVSVQVKDNRGALSNIATRNVAITTIPQTITFGPLADKRYGDADFGIGATASSEFDVLFAASGNCSLAGTTVRLTGAGSCTVTASQPGNGIYAPADDVVRSFAIAKANATVTVTGYEGAYDGEAHGATGTATGVKGEDLASLLTLGNSFTNGPGGTARWAFAGNGNYEAQTGTAAIVISKANATVSVNGYTGVYDGEAHGAAGTATGVKGENLAALLTLGDSFTNGPGGTAAWTFAGDGNYELQTGTAAVVISKANATVTVTGYTGVYDGEAHGATGTATGVKGENLAALLTLGNPFTNAPGGTATWTFTGDRNYNAATGEAAIAISRATLTVTADDKTMTVGAPLPAFGAAFSGFVGGESAAALSGLLQFTTPATPSSSVGTYAITPGGVASGNYDITFVPGTLTISYAVCLAYDDARVHNSGSTIPIKLQLCDTARGIRNSPSVIVHATQLVRVSTQAAGTVEDAGEANPDDDFRLTGTGYLFNLQTKGLATGTYSLFFSVTGDPSPHSVLFKIR